MSWIILALTLGASITSIIHGVFMLFGSLSITGAAIPGIPSTMLASLPVISAIFALIGGIMAFNQSKWGAFFLFIAMGLCAATRDTWLYAGLYFFAGVFCFLLKPRQQNDYDYLNYEDYDEDDAPPRGSDDFYYEDEDEESEHEEMPYREPGIRHSPFRNLNLQQTPDEDNALGLQLNSEPAKIRRRMTKTCPECFAIVSREERVCHNCGAILSVSPELDEVTQPLVPGQPENGDVSIKTISEQLSVPVNVQEVSEIEQEADNDAGKIEAEEQTMTQEINLSTEDDDEDMSTAPMTSANRRVTAKPRRDEPEYRQPQSKRKPSMANDAAASYRNFSNSKIARTAKKRKRSAGRKVLSMLLLVAAVGGALYFLLGLRKLPPGDLPPMARTEITESTSGTTNAETMQVNLANDAVVEPVDVAVAENVLPNFVPDLEPKSGTIVGSNVNVRADHTTSARRVTRLSVGSRVEVIGSFNVPSGQYSGIWYNIRTGNNEGWIYGRYVQPLGTGLPDGYSDGLLKSFGSSLTQLVDTFGNPTRKTSSSAEWSGITATLRGEDITRIRVTGANRELQNGLKPGMSQTALLQIMGYPSSVSNRVMNYNEAGKVGVSVQLDRNNAISSITVNELQ